MKNPAQHPSQESEHPRHMSFLLRLWQAGGSETTNWRASLENPGIGKRIGFANLERLFAYLMEMTEGYLGATTEDDPANATHGHLPEP